MRRGGAAGRWLTSVAASLLLASCAVTDPTQYYVLGRATAGGAESRASAPPAAATPTEGGGVTIGVGPVIVPSYLDRINVVTRTAGDQVEISTFHRWAEPLSNGIARILSEEVAARVPTQRVVAFPWRGLMARVIQYQVVVTVLRFDGRLGDAITLDARWRLLGGDGKELTLRRTTLTEAAAGPGYEAMVTAMDRALALLSEQIASEIRATAR